MSIGQVGRGGDSGQTMQGLGVMDRIFIFIVIFILDCYGRGTRKVNVAAGWKVDGGRNSLIGNGLDQVDVGGDGEEWLDLRDRKGVEGKGVQNTTNCG